MKSLTLEHLPKIMLKSFLTGLGSWGTTTLIQHFPSFGSKAPAASLQGIAARVREDVGEKPLQSSAKHACRDAHRFVQKWGLAWNIPFSYLDHVDTETGEPCPIPFVSPKSFIRFLLEKTPELVLGGHQDIDVGKQNLHEFWANYLKVHPSHVMAEVHGLRQSNNTLAMCLHGDEGRGLKKGNTCVLMLETVLGMDMSIVLPNQNLQPCDCYVEPQYAKRFRLNSGNAAPPAASKLCEKQVTNLKQNSFLTKFVLAAIPNKYYKKTDILERLLEKCVADLCDLFTDGLQINRVNNNVRKEERWFVSLVGLKGDLRWYEKIAKLTRCFNKQLRTGACMCHECMAGTQACPFENASHVPPWSDTIFTERPWDPQNQPCIANIPFDGDVANNKEEKILRRDIFHNAKVGILRDYCGSCVMLLIGLGYFREPGASNARDVMLERAHSHFTFFCKTLGKCPALHSFSLQFFNATTRSDFAWVNAKASDVTLMVSWLVVLCAGLVRDPIEPGHVDILETLYECGSSAKKFLGIIYSHNLWLTRDCATALYQSFHSFLACYNKLAFMTMYKYNQVGFGLKSKYHLVAHEKLDLWMQLVAQPEIKYVLNPAIFACDMCEDVVGKLSRLSRRVSPRTPSKRTLELYFIKCKAVHRRFKVKPVIRQPKQIKRWEMRAIHVCLMADWGLDEASSRPSASAEKKRSKVNPLIKLYDMVWMFSLRCPHHSLLSCFVMFFQSYHVCISRYL